MNPEFDTILLFIKKKNTDCDEKKKEEKDLEKIDQDAVKDKIYLCIPSRKPSSMKHTRRMERLRCVLFDVRQRSRQTARYCSFFLFCGFFLRLYYGNVNAFDHQRRKQKNNNIPPFPPPLLFLRVAEKGRKRVSKKRKKRVSRREKEEGERKDGMKSHFVTSCSRLSCRNQKTHMNYT